MGYFSVVTFLETRGVKVKSGKKFEFRQKLIKLNIKKVRTFFMYVKRQKYLK